jgi:hypothetical protein
MARCVVWLTLTYVPEINRYVAPLMVYSNDIGSEVSFMIWDGLEDTVFVAAQTLAMEPTKLNGRLRYPVVLTNIGTGTGTDARQEAEQQVFRISPNPFEKELSVDFHDQKPGTYRIVMYNTLGDLVLSERIESQRGENRVVLRPKADTRCRCVLRYHAQGRCHPANLQGGEDAALRQLTSYL